VPAAPVKAIERQRPVDRQWQWIVGVQKPPDRGRDSRVRVDRMRPGEQHAGCLAWIVCRWPLRGRKFAAFVSPFLGACLLEPRRSSLEDEDCGLGRLMCQVILAVRVKTAAFPVRLAVSCFLQDWSVGV
jgi:hypothetical protein